MGLVRIGIGAVAISRYGADSLLGLGIGIGFGLIFGGHPDNSSNPGRYERIKRPTAKGLPCESERFDENLQKCQCEIPTYKFLKSGGKVWMRKPFKCTPSCRSCFLTRCSKGFCLWPTMLITGDRITEESSRCENLNTMANAVDPFVFRVKFADDSQDFRIVP